MRLGSPEHLPETCDHGVSISRYGYLARRSHTSQRPVLTRIESAPYHGWRLLTHTSMDPMEDIMGTTKNESRYLHVASYRYRRVQITSVRLRLRGCWERTLSLAPSRVVLQDDYGHNVRWARSLSYVPIPQPVKRPRWLERLVRRGGKRLRRRNRSVATAETAALACQDSVGTRTCVRSVESAGSTGKV